VLYSGGLLINPSSLALSPYKEELYITDGGEYFGGYVGGSEYATEYLFALDFLNLTHLAVELHASDVGVDIRGGVYSDPNAATENSQGYSSLVVFVASTFIYTLSAYSVASISQTASQLSFGLTDAINTAGTKPLQPQFQQQLLSFVE